jgi:hypothetical protein
MRKKKSFLIGWPLLKISNCQIPYPLLQRRLESKDRFLTSVGICFGESRNIYVISSTIESLEYISHTGQAFIHRIAQPYGDEQAGIQDRIIICR